MTLDGNVCPEAEPQFRVALADAVLFYPEKDADEADRFIQSLTNAMRLIGKPIIINRYDDLANQTTELESVDQVCKVSVQQWFYVTENLLEDETMRFHKDVQIMKSLTSRRSFVPLWTKPKSEFGEELPYGMAAYKGINIAPLVGDGEEASGGDPPEHQPRVTAVVNTFDRMFSRPEHQARKQELDNKRKEEMERWAEMERVRRTELKRIADERHQANLEALREALRNAHVDVPADPDELCHKYVLQQMQQQEATRTPPRSSRNASPSSPDAAIPEYLLNSLNSHRSSTGSPRTVRNVYNITINNPQRVVIGGETAHSPGSGGPGSGAETVYKNIQINNNPPAPTMPTQETDQSGASSGSSFDLIHPPQEESGDSS